jgi:hypothetical protein
MSRRTSEVRLVSDLLPVKTRSVGRNHRERLMPIRLIGRPIWGVYPLTVRMQKRDISSDCKLHALEQVPWSSVKSRASSHRRLPSQ